MPFNPAQTKPMLSDAHFRKLHYRAHHRGTREADAIVGGFFDVCSGEWNADEVAWFERLLEEQDVDIIGWAMRTVAVPPEYQGPMMERIQQLDFVTRRNG
jgi:antitoxin CptB